MHIIFNWPSHVHTKKKHLVCGENQKKPTTSIINLECFRKRWHSKTNRLIFSYYFHQIAILFVHIPYRNNKNRSLKKKKEMTILCPFPFVGFCLYLLSLFNSSNWITINSCCYQIFMVISHMNIECHSNLHLLAYRLILFIDGSNWTAPHKRLMHCEVSYKHYSYQTPTNVDMTHLPINNIMG